MRLEVIEQCSMCPFLTRKRADSKMWVYCSRDPERSLVKDVRCLPMWCPLITESITLTAVWRTTD